MTDILIVRHGQPVSGQRDPHLAPEGIADARALATWLSHERIDTIVASPLTRAVQTAEEIADGLGRAVDHIVPDLREWDDDVDPHDYVALEDMSPDDPRMRAVAEGRYEDYVPQLDLAKFRARARSAVDALFDRYPRQRVVAVAHGGIINAVIADVLGMPVTFWHNPAYTSVARIRRLGSGVVVVDAVNDTAHLRGVPFPTTVSA